MGAFKEKIWNPLQVTFSNKKVKIWAIVVASTLVVVMLASLVIQNIFTYNYIVYWKEDMLMYSVFSGGTPQKIGKTINGHYNYPCVNKDRTRIFYCASENEDGPLILYYRQMNLPNSAPVRISSGKGDVLSFIINEQGSAVVYNEEERVLEGTLYYSDFTNNQKIATGVYLHEWDMSPDGKRVVWRDVAGDAYFRIIGKEAEKIDNNVKRFLHVSEDCKTVWYLTNDGGLYRKEMNKETVKIASNIEFQIVNNIESLLRVYDSGEAYFLKKETVERNRWERVVDDKKEEDAKMQKPIWEEFLKQYNNNQSLAQSEYELAMNEWEKKLERDKIREYLNTPSEREQTNLYYYDGKKVHLVSENVMPWVKTAEETEVAIYFKNIYNKNYLSELKYNFESDSVSIPGKSNLKVYLTVKEKEVSVDLDNVSSVGIGISSNGKMAYAICKGELLYRIYTTGKKTGNTEYISKGVSAGARIKDVWPMKGQLAYKIENQSGGDSLYVNGRKISSSASGVDYHEATDALFYRESEGLDLMRYKDGKVTKIGENLGRINSLQYVVTPSGQVFYIKKENGTKVLYQYRAFGAKRIDAGKIYLYDAFTYTTNRDFWVPPDVIVG